MSCLVKCDMFSISYHVMVLFDGRPWLTVRHELFESSDQVNGISNESRSPRRRTSEHEPNINETPTVLTKRNVCTNLHVLILFNQLSATNAFEVAVYAAQNDGLEAVFGMWIKKETSDVLSSADGPMTSCTSIRSAALLAMYRRSVGNVSTQGQNGTN